MSGQNKPVIEMQQQEVSKNNGTAPSGPLSIGITIKNDEEIKKLEEIIDEERRITVQGYIFFAETRELRSGRTLSHLKSPTTRIQFQSKDFLVIKKMLKC